VGAAQLASAVLAALYLLAICLAGLWLVLPWWLAFVYPVLLLAAASRVFLVSKKREQPSGLATATLPICWLTT
jgi:hypothetical protein